jgi:hypothetical protein
VRRLTGSRAALPTGAMPGCTRAAPHLPGPMPPGTKSDTAPPLQG